MRQCLGNFNADAGFRLVPTKLLTIGMKTSAWGTRPGFGCLSGSPSAGIWLPGGGSGRLGRFRSAGSLCDYLGGSLRTLDSQAVPFPLTCDNELRGLPVAALRRILFQSKIALLCEKTPAKAKRPTAC